MKSALELLKEIKSPVSGEFAPYYFRFEGIKNHLSDSYTSRKAREIFSLFTQTEAHIFKNDLIAGSVLGAYCDTNDIRVEYAKKMMETFKSRGFATNTDHYSPNYPTILKKGIPELIVEINEAKEIHKNDAKRTETLEAMKRCLEGFLVLIKNYASKAEKLKNSHGYNNENLDFIAENCRAVAVGAPSTFAQALQLVWLCHTAFLLEKRYAMALGRMDVYLYPFYESDLKKGILTKETATELLANVFAKISDDDVVNICIGGMDKNHKCQINDLSYCIIRAVKNNMSPGPNLSARITPDTPDEFFDEALQSIGTGLGYPALMNDVINIEALKKYGYDDDDIYEYSMVGCIENFITGKQPPWSDQRFDTPKYIDFVLNNGISPFNESTGLSLGEAETITTMQEFITNLEKQLAYGVSEYCAIFNSTNDSINQKYFPEPFLSCFCDNCIERGLDINDGGSKYPSVHGAGIMGIGTMCDSLAAIEKVIFNDKASSLAELRDALNANFEGYDELHQKLLQAPKYGNNDQFVDKYAIWLVDYISSQFLKYKTRDGGGIYIAIATNVQNVCAGNVTGATPDGRLRGAPLSDAASPTYGKDKSGVTSTMCSVSKPDYTKVACGTVVNQKFTPEFFNDANRPKLISLIKTYFKMGGHEMQINATSRETLIDAMEHPQNYDNLVVRVSGFSAYYTKLAKGVQTDILNRTQQKI